MLPAWRHWIVSWQEGGLTCDKQGDWHMTSREYPPSLTSLNSHVTSRGLTRDKVEQGEWHMMSRVLTPLNWCHPMTRDEHGDWGIDTWRVGGIPLNWHHPMTYDEQGDEGDWHLTSSGHHVTVHLVIFVHFSRSFIGGILNELKWRFTGTPVTTVKPFQVLANFKKMKCAHSLQRINFCNTYYQWLSGYTTC